MKRILVISGASTAGIVVLALIGWGMVASKAPKHQFIVADEEVLYGGNGTIATSTNVPPAKNEEPASIFSLGNFNTDSLSDLSNVGQIITQAVSPGVMTDNTPETAPSVAFGITQPPRTSPFVLSRDFLAGWSLGTSTASAEKDGTDGYGNVVYKMTFDSPWQGVSLNNPIGTDASSYDGIGLYVKGTTGTEDIYVILYDRNGDKLGSQRIDDFLINKKMPTNDPALCFIPFRVINPDNKVIGRIELQSGYADTAYLSNVTFMNTPDGQPLGSYLFVTIPGIYSDDTQNGWNMSNNDAVTVNIASNEYPHPHPVNFVFHDSGGELDFANDLGFKSNRYSRFSFVIKGDANKAHLSLSFYDTNGDKLGTKLINEYVDTTRITDYQTVNFSLDEINPANSAINKIAFNGDTETTDPISIDDITFTP